MENIILMHNILNSLILLFLSLLLSISAFSNAGLSGGKDKILIGEYGNEINVINKEIPSRYAYYYLVSYASFVVGGVLLIRSLSNEYGINLASYIASEVILLYLTLCTYCVYHVYLR